LVNSKKETGTLFPKAYLSILPKSERKIDRIKNPLILSFKELEKCIYDVFEANQKYLKSEIIYFSLESWYIDECTALDIIQKKIAEEANADLHVKTIWFQCG
jgi:hypothetical protein